MSVSIDFLLHFPLTADVVVQANILKQLFFMISRKNSKKQAKKTWKLIFQTRIFKLTNVPSAYIT